MLAYVFWHWPLPTIATHDYSNRLAAFHQSLRNNAFPGFLSSHIFQLARVPWSSSEQPLYEDWYLVEDFTALGTLNEMAVAAINKSPHDQAASYAADGKAGVYRLCEGNADPVQAHVACWFGKPAGMSYQTFFSVIRPLLEAQGGALWQRQMTLGPTPEFCWWTSGVPELPEEFNKIVVPLVYLAV